MRGLIVLLMGMLGGGCATVPMGPGVETDYDVVIVGSGLGGLSAGAHLAGTGRKVLLLEQHFKVGGCTSSFVRGEFAFDTALHAMSIGGGEGFVVELMRQAGVADKVEMIRVPDLGRSVFPDREVMQKDGASEFAAELISHWPEEADAIRAYFELLNQLAEDIGALRDVYFSNPVKAFVLKLGVPFRQRTLAKWSRKTLQDVLDTYFEDDQLKSAVAQFWVYYGPPPEALWSIIYLSAQHSYVNNGGWQFKGSSSALSEAYAERIVEQGGTVETSVRVEKITIEDGRVTGVVTDDGREISSRYVVSNADPFQTFFKLVSPEHVPRRIRRQVKQMEPATSLAGVYLGLDVPVSELGIDDYELFYNASWDHQVMNRAMKEGRFEDGMVAMTFYSNLPDAFYAPPDKGAMVLHTYSEWDYWSDDAAIYELQKSDMMDALINVAEKMMPGLRNHIVFKEGMTPRTIHHYTLNYKGSPYGAAFTVDQKDRMDVDSGIPGLYLAGSWVFPAHSVAMAQVSGYMAARYIMKEDSAWHRSHR